MSNLTWMINFCSHGPLNFVAFTKYRRPSGTRNTDFDVPQALLHALMNAWFGKGIAEIELNQEKSIF